MAYEIFNRKRQYRGTAAITLTKFGQLSFNKSSTEILKKQAIETVLLLWDKEKRSVGIQAINKKDSRSFTIRWSSRGDGAGFSAASFMKYIEYNATESRSFPVQWNDEQQMFEFSIDKDCFIEDGYVTPMRKKKKNKTK